MKLSAFTYIQHTIANEQDWVELGLFCVDICRAPEWGMDDGDLREKNSSVPTGREVEGMTGNGGRTVHLRQVDKGTGTFQTLGPGRLRCARGTSLCRFVSCLSTHTVVSALSVCTMVKWLRFFLRNGHCERQAQGASDPQAASENKARSQRRHGWVI